MKNKSFVLFLTLLITAFCLYSLMFTYQSRQINDEATEFAQTDSGTVSMVQKQYFMDSLWNKTVYTLFGAEFTLKEVKQKEINLGLDLKGGMHVVLEVSPAGLIKAMAGRNADAELKQALEMADERQKESQSQYSTLFYEAFQEVSPGKKLNQVFANSANKETVNFETTDEEVLRLIEREIDRAVDRSLTILRSRIDKFGVTQPNIQQIQGTNRIQVELAGVDNPKRVRKLLQGVAKLEFLEVYPIYEIYNSLEKYNEYLYVQEQAEKAKSDTSENEGDELAGEEGISDLLAGSESEETNIEASPEDSAVTPSEDDWGTSEEDTATESDDASEEGDALEDLLAGEDDDTGSAAAQADSAKVDSLNTRISALFRKVYIDQNNMFVESKFRRDAERMLAQDKIKGFFPPGTEFLFAHKPRVNEDNGTEFYEIIPIKRLRGGKAPLNGEVVTNANSNVSPQGRGWEVTLSMNSKGAMAWKRLTEQLGANPLNDPRRVAIVLDNLVYSAPVVQGTIPNGRTSITGSFSKEEAKDLANVLKAGSLPAPLRIVEEAVVGPSIGEESVSQGLRSIIAGLCLVIIFMILYYSRGGIVADTALFVNIFFIIGLLAQLKASLTLPGIAGIVLTIGMSIDANVLIFERIKEELALGRIPLKAIDNGFRKAFWTIFDSNVTTFIVGVILAVFGSGPVRGFAVTLMIGIGCSFFTAVFVSRLIISYMTRKNEGAKMSFDSFISKGLLKNVNINFIGRRKLAYTISILIIIAGIAATTIKGGLNLGVDFKGGRSYVVNFDEAVNTVDIRSAIKSEVGESSVEAKVYGQDSRVKITTSYLVDDESQEADAEVESTVMGALKDYSNLNPEILSSSKVGATIADDIKNTSVQSMIIAIVLIFLYILIRFRKWQFGMGAIIALIHDVLVVLSMFAIARLFGLAYEVDQVFIAAILTIIGYSINDTVVVFDRVREFLTEKPSADTRDTFNKSINSTLSRTLMTSLTTLLVVLVLFIFGGEALRGFSFALLVGVLFGTYSSIFIATPVVLDTAMRKKKNRSGEQL